MKALVLHEFGGPENLKLEEVPQPTVGPMDVLLRVRACGVCHHDVINRQGKFPRTKLPVIMGHEIAGEVVEVGPQVKTVAPGDRVATIQKIPCGVCRYCSTGRESLCEEGPGFFGEILPGGYAEYVIAQEQALCKIPGDMSFEVASILACAIGTTLHAVRDRLKVKLGDTVLITGASGGLGLHFIQMVKLAGGRVIGITSAQEKIDRIKSLGADEVVYAPDFNFHNQVKGLTNGRGVDAAVEIVGSATFPSTFRSLASGGRLLFVGNVLAQQVQFPPALLILKELEFHGTNATSRQELMEVIELVRDGRIKPMIDRTLPLEKGAESHRLLTDRQVSGRVVLLP